MKKCVLFQLFLLFMLSHLTANTPTVETTGNPLPERKLPLESMISDWGALPEKNRPADGVQVETTSPTNKAQRYAFPELDQQIMAAVEEALPMLSEDDMSDLLQIPPNEEEIAGMQAIEAAQAGGTHVDNFDDLLNLKLPAYRIQKMGNVEAIIVINSLRLVTGSAVTDGLDPGGRLGIYVGVKIPQKGRDSQGRKKNITLIFGTESLAFTNEGGIQTGNIRLVNDVGFPLGSSQKKTVVFLKKGDLGTGTGTFIKFGCNGVEEFALGAEVHFSKEWLVSLDTNGDPHPNGPRVVGTFQANVQDWNNMLLGVNLQNFALAKWDKMTFSIGNAKIDLSDYKNPANVTFPVGYLDDIHPKELWRGVYIETVEITLPAPFKRKCDGDYGNNNDPEATGCRMKINVNDLLIDSYGVTGEFNVGGPTPIASGGLMNKKWKWSIDTLGVELYQSRFAGFSFKGGIVVPITKEDTPFAYTGGVSFTGGEGFDPQNAEYFFNVELEEEVEFPLFNAFNVVIEPNSSLDISVTDGEFKPSVTLYGEMSLGKGNPEEDDVRIPKVIFENIQLQTEGNFINGGSVFIDGGGNKVNNFPVQISGIGIGFSENSVHLNVAMGLNLMQQQDGGLTASGNFKIYGKLETDIIGAHRWTFDKFVMDGFNVLIDLPAFKGCGALSFFNGDPTYGKGFSAYLDAKVLGEGMGEENYTCGAEIESAFSLSMAAIFGNKDGMRYFMVDGYVSGEALTIPLPPTPLSLTGFGGGVQYRMKIAGHADNQPEGSAIPAGMDTSGLIYEPDPETLFGIKFAVGITTTGMQAAGGSPINGKLAVIVRFGNGLSLQNITFWGTAELVNPVAEGGIQIMPDVLDKIDDLALTDAARHQQDLNQVQNAVDKIMAKVGISLDFEDGFSFHGFAEVKLNVANGKINGSGQLDLLIDPGANKWHLFVGGYDNGAVTVPDFFNPENEITLYPVSVAIDYGGLNVVAKSYFLLGNDIPGPPPINAEAASFFGISNASNNRDILYCNGNSPASGTGVAFGASMSMKFSKKIKKKILFAKVTIIDIKVNGGAGFDIALLQYGPNTSCQGGQSPHGLNNFRATGRVWAYINVKGKVLGVPLPAIGVGALLEADVPDPSYFKALVVLKFIKKWNFNFDIGQECGHPCSVADG